MSVLSNIGLPDNRTRVDYSSGSNGDIINTIHKNFAAAVRETKNVANSFRGGNNLETAHKIWNFLRDKIKYQMDPKGVQQVRLPKRFLHERKGDCKSFSLFTAGILRNLNLPVTFRYASYSASKTPGHVYVVTKDEQGNNIIIDGVWTRFDDEKTPTHKPTDYTMRIETLSGVNGINGRKAGKKRKLKDLFKKGVGLFKKTNPALVLGRSTFLGLVRLNIRSFASRLEASLKKSPDTVKKIWVEKLGGGMKALESSIKAGAKKKPLFPKKIKGIYYVEGLGSAAAAGTAIAAAMPVIVVVVKQIFAKLGHANESEVSEAQEEAKEALETEVDEDEVKDLSTNGKGPGADGGKGGSFFGFDPTSGLDWINLALKASITATGIANIL